MFFSHDTQHRWKSNWESCRVEPCQSDTRVHMDWKPKQTAKHNWILEKRRGWDREQPPHSAVRERAVQSQKRVSTAYSSRMSFRKSVFIGFKFKIHACDLQNYLSNYIVHIFFINNVKSSKFRLFVFTVASKRSWTTYKTGFNESSLPVYNCSFTKTCFW